MFDFLGDIFDSVDSVDMLDGAFSVVDSLTVIVILGKVAEIIREETKIY